MALITGTIPNFANGVSQQALALRLASQGTEQINAYSTVVDGLKKRPPTSLRAYLGTGAPFTGDVFTHTIDRDVAERYIVLLSTSGVRVFDLLGVEKTVVAAGGYSYLSNIPTDLLPYKALTVGDYTFIANRTKVVAMDTGVIETVSPSEAIINVQAGNYGKDYTIKIDGTEVARYRTPEGNSAAQAPAVDVSYIARRLNDGVAVALDPTVNGTANGGWTFKATDKNLNTQGINAANGWTVEVFKSTIYIKKNSGAAFTIECDDGYNNNAMKAIKGSVQDFADLPSYCRNEMAIEVTGSVGTEFDNYYVRFDSQGSTTSTGVWREIPEPGLSKALLATTMPHALIRQSDGTFTFGPLDWSLRKAGDNNTAPVPSFVGRTVNSLLFFKNRLGFLSQENVILSRSGDYFDWFRATATALLDDDPIDVASTEAGVSILRHAVAFSDRLVLFSDQMQAILAGNELLTPKTASIRTATAYPCSSLAQPVLSGASIFFPADRGKYSMMQEYSVDPQSNTAEADDTTSHVPQYLKGRVRRISASTHEDIITCLMDDDVASMYVYKYYWSGQNKLQASWSKWTFPGVTKILDTVFIGSEMIMIVLRGTKAYIESMEVQPGDVDDNAAFVCHLDRRFIVSAVGATYSALTDQTTLTMTEDITSGDYQCVTVGVAGEPLEAGAAISIVSKGPTEVVLVGDVRDCSLYFGLPYSLIYTPSTIFLRKEASGGGVTVIGEGRLQVLKFLIQYSKTAYFRVEVTPEGRDMRVYHNDVRKFGSPNNIVGETYIADGKFSFPVLSRNDRVRISIINDSYLPCSLISAEWTARFIQKSTRV